VDVTTHKKLIIEYQLIYLQDKVGEIRSLNKKLVFTHFSTTNYVCMHTPYMLTNNNYSTIQYH
jgi:hypothetical protein